MLPSLFAPFLSGTPSCTTAKNFLNAQYTLPLHVGTPPQELWVVPDTGSFELVLSSAECKGCGHHRRYHRNMSSTYAPKTPTEPVVIQYGQGKVESEAVYDTASIDSLVSSRQSILLMQHNGLKDYNDAVYDGVMGLGINSLARTADTDMTFMANTNTKIVSLCYGQHDQEPGRIQFGERPADDPLNFTQLPLLGDSHWAVSLQGIRLSGGAANKTTTLSECRGAGNCNAIIDSGTSLIAVPSTIHQQLLDLIGEVKPDCSCERAENGTLSSIKS